MKVTATEQVFKKSYHGLARDEHNSLPMSYLKEQVDVKQLGWVLHLAG